MPTGLCTQQHLILRTGPILVLAFEPRCTGWVREASARRVRVIQDGGWLGQSSGMYSPVLRQLGRGCDQLVVAIVLVGCRGLVVHVPIPPPRSGAGLAV
eukprot:CAMPEP_0206252494 /NCGR_PEP_ID=MMETSP0047_2-20121206/22620_1 /ASSEMBLY_ACC=CAM_ASM_000192 /TAXON_ID=195065 /ORGANISM="Chroomonas mesostigmatica_cf, Strain CCMP1168" /LENGTH=98 /DNA_ID=CAMNT_0053678583 /DNA_START=192 /DNA_END=484 /DNA_ORIENTATION=-